MQFQRVSPTEILVFGPLEVVREATWHALREARVADATIDTEQNVVAGSTGDGVLTVARSVTAHLMAGTGGIVVVFAAKAVLGGTIDFGAGKKAARKIADALERVLNSNFGSNDVVGPQAQSGLLAAPIAAPSGEAAPFVPSTGPLYGPLRAPKRGMTLFVYGLMSLICCQILAPFTIVCSIGALRDYKQKGDPGDRGMVVTGLVLGVLGSVVLLLNIAARVSGIIK